MTKSAHLWAIGYDNIARADQVRDKIIELGWGTTQYLMLDDVAVVVRHPDGSFTLNREEFPAASNVVGCSVVGFIAGLVLGAPMTGATIGAMIGGAGSAAVSASAGIGDDFVREVKELMKPGTSAKNSSGRSNASHSQMKRAALSAESTNSTPPLWRGCDAMIPTGMPESRARPVTISRANSLLISKKLPSSHSA